MRVLGIETSCDETASAVIVTTNEALQLRLVSNVVRSQIDLHAQYGGVVPNLAKREHERLLSTIVLQALTEADCTPTPLTSPSNEDTLAPFFERNQALLETFRRDILPLGKPDIDLIAVTNGPGLEPALWVGVTFARALALHWGIPLVGVDHMEGHIAANFINEVSGISNIQFSIPKQKSSLAFPVLALTISGGHTQLVLMPKLLEYKLLGETVDDAAGEAFDKVARMLGLPYPGGPSISAAAKNGNPTAFDLPRPMAHSGDYNFSFSGLKTAVRYILDAMDETTRAEATADMAASFQQAVIDTVIAKTVKATQEYGA
ncbi:MAG: tRNA (adenosine(37)-N6)-threonylcarbamoyltransferase complex transferase subunit TsaD, partial [Candidatus Spechtbacterales bacterium]